MEELEWKEHEKDWLDWCCDNVLESLDVPSIDDKIAILEQCLDYLRMEKASDQLPLEEE